MGAGRPVIYDENYVKAALAYIEECEDKIENVVSGESEKFTAYKQKLTVNLPSIEGLALYLSIHKDTIYDWCAKYPEFSDVINVLRAKQAKQLINMGLSGDYNPIIAKLLLAKHGYKEAAEVDLSAKIDFRDAE